MNVSISPRLAAATFAIAGVCSGVLAQHDPAFGPPPPAPNASTQGVPVVNEKPAGIFKADVDEEFTFPRDMPPLGKIPPMPMSAGGYRGGAFKQSGGRMIMYDAATGRVEESPAAIVKNLADIEGGGFAGLYSVGDGDVPSDWNSTMSTVSDGLLTSWPYRANCKLAMRRLKTDGTYVWHVCSGTMIDAETVLTAGQCVYTHAAGFVEGWATEVYVFPGWDGTGEVTTSGPGYPVPEAIFNSWGFARGTSYGSWSTWTSGADLDGDVGLIKVTRAVGMLTGWYGWNFGSTCSTFQSRAYNNISYPAESCSPLLHTGAQMYSWSGVIDSCPSNQLQLNTGSGCTTAVWGGMTGSSMAYTSGAGRNASAVCSTSNRTSTANYCRLFEAFVTLMNDTIIPEARTSTLDLQALDCNLTATSWAAGSSVSGLTFNACNPTNANPASQIYSYSIYLSSNSNISSSDSLLAQQSYTADYAAMQNLTINCGAFNIPTSVTPGTYYIGVILDSGTGGDNNAGNNESDAWDAVQITVTGCANPAAPTGISSINFQHCDRNELTWTGMANATSYQIWRSTTNDSATATLRATIATTTYNDFNVVDGIRYFYWLKAVYPCGTSGFSAVSDNETNYAPSAATDIVASDGASCGSVAVTWSTVARATSYRIYRGISNNFATAVPIGSTSTSPYVDSTGTPGSIYFYFVVAENACGAAAASASDTGWSSSLLSPPSLQSFEATTNLCDGVNLTWPADNGADRYEIYRNTTDTIIGSALAGTSITPSFFDATIPAGTTAFYFIRSGNVCGLSEFSASRAGARGEAPAAPPAGVQLSSGSGCLPSLTLSWNSAPASDLYKIYRSTGFYPEAATLIATVTTTFHDDTTAIGNTFYYYWVKASNACGDSDFSDTSYGRRGNPPPHPSGVRASDGTGCRSVIVSWYYPEFSGVTFEIYRNTVRNSHSAVLVGSSLASPFVDDTVVGTTPYYYWVTATYPCGSSDSGDDTGYSGSAVSITSHPIDLTVNERQSASFSVGVTGGLTYHWRRNGVPLPLDGGTGILMRTMYLNPVSTADAGLYDCVVNGACESITSNAALLTVIPAPCAADFNQDGGVDGADISAFFNAWEGGESDADVNIDGGIDGSDVDAFFIVWENGGC